MGSASITILKCPNLQTLGWLLLTMQMALAAKGADQLAKPPDPLTLLETVAQARQKIASGEMEFDVSRYSSDRLLDGTNQISLKVVFAGEKRRFEQFGREYRNVLMGPNADTVTEAKRQELGLDNEAAVRAGLLTGFESRYVTVYDGSLLMEYWETDGNPFQTKIDDPAKGSSTYLFDPRVLGLTPSPSARDTIGSCLTHTHAGSVQLAGKESVDGVIAWHIRVPYPWVTYDYWIDANHPSRVVKCGFNGDTVFSKYDDANPDDPIPTVLRSVIFYGRERARSDVQVLRRSARYNVPVDQASWTLAGLKMPVGTEVSDDRIRRRVGYWDGRGLSENPPPRPAQPSKKTQTSPNPAKLLTLAEKDPKSAFALEAATWVILNTPDGPEVEKAAEIIQREHIRSPNLVQLCEGLERLSHSSVIPLLELMLKENPDTNVQARACFTLATMMKNQANETGDNQAANNAARLFERVFNDYGQVAESGGMRLADRAIPELFELRRLGVGRIAPEIEGEDLNGRKMKLSDYRGKVVVLNFWGTWCGPCMAMVPDERKLVERMDGKAFALIGVNSDDDLAKVKVIVNEKKMTWPSFRDGLEGPISKAWNVQSWPTVYVLDLKGVIRYRDLRGQALFDAVEKLIREEE
jgi:thiol-disulfide isomerase/thioredoxin